MRYFFRIWQVIRLFLNYTESPIKTQRKSRFTGGHLSHSMDTFCSSASCLRRLSARSALFRRSKRPVSCLYRSGHGAAANRFSCNPTPLPGPENGLPANFPCMPRIRHSRGSPFCCPLHGRSSCTIHDADTSYTATRLFLRIRPKHFWDAAFYFFRNASGPPPPDGS